MTHPLAPLAAYRQFIAVKLVPLPNGKTDKLPVSPFGQVGVDAHDAANWQSWIEADALARALGAGHTVGFVLTAADPFWCLDIDHCLKPDGSWSDLALQLVAALPGTAREVSQSGTGLHIWGAGPVPEHSKKNTKLGIELYTELRFIALGHGHVGEIVPDAPGIAQVAANLFPPRLATAHEIPDTGPREDWAGPTDDDELIRRMLASTSVAGAFAGRATIADLWAGNVEALARALPSSTGQPFDASSADMALAMHLAWWTGCDLARMERLMRRSGLARAKWDERPEYLVDWTLTNACAGTTSVYRDPRATAPPAPPAAPEPAAVTLITPGVSSPTAVQQPFPGVLEGVQAPGGTLTSAVAAGHTASLASLDCTFAEIGLQITFDEFKGRIMLQPHGAPAPITYDAEVHPIMLRRSLELSGFKAIKAETMRDAIKARAYANRFDSAMQWGHSLIWDGTPRIERFWVDYLGVVDTPYARAVGLYWWTGLAGRMMSPGVQADMAPILVGGQGARKSTALKAMVPSRDLFCEIDFSKPDDDLARQTQGKLVCELSELRGLGGRSRDHEATKAYVSRDSDEWIPKYQEDAKSKPRRFLIAGTTNRNTFLGDPTGERRWLPDDVGRIDIDAIVRDRDQLWAEGVSVFLASGVAWRNAESLARDVHARYTQRDDWAEPLAEFLAANPGPVTLAQVFMGVLKKPLVAAQYGESKRMTDLLHAAGRRTGQARVEGRVTNLWLPGPPGLGGAPR